MLKFCRNQKRRNPYELDYDVQVTECKAVYLRICVAQTHRHFLPSRRSLNRLLDTSLGENYIDYVSCISPQTFAFYSLYSQFSTYSALRIYAAKSKPTRGQKNPLINQSVACADFLCIPKLMGTEKNSNSLFASQIVYHLIDILRTFRIQARSWFVKKQNFRVV